MFEVFGKMPGKLIVFPDDITLCDSDDMVKFHEVLYRNRGFDRRMRIIAFNPEIFILELENIFDFWIEKHFR